jgi:cyclopropane fatty-acyl-phospholipid synthase-like methyltransferase
MNIKKGWNTYFKDKKVGTLDKKLTRKLITFLKLLKKGRILELGSGDGKYCFFISKNKNFEILGIDYSKEAIRGAKNYKNKYKIKNVNFKLGNIIKLSKKSIFDAIIMINSYHCLTNNKRKIALSTIKKILKKDGLIFICILSTKDKFNPREDWTEIEENTYQDKAGRIFHFFSDKEIKNELKEFKIIRFTHQRDLDTELDRHGVLSIIYAKNRC